MRGFARVSTIEGIDELTDEFMRYVKPEVLKLMRVRQRKFRFVFNPEMIRQFESEEIRSEYPYFHSETFINLVSTDESEEYEIAVNTIQERLQNFNQMGSNWVFNRVVFLDIHMTVYSFE